MRNGAPLTETRSCIAHTLRRACVKVVAIAMYAALPLVATAQDEVKWPDFPLLTIETVDGVMPTYTVVNPPAGCLGQGIISEHVPGRLVITLKGETLYDSGDFVKGESGMRIKMRGNTSAIAYPQHPYKLKLSKKADLLNIGKKYENKDWALLSMGVSNLAVTNKESNILFLVGLAVCRTLDMPWTPRTRFVNLVLNGHYEGLYHLTETVKRSDERVNIGETGFLIENDAYWWKPGELYFKTDKQHPLMGYTFKYPDADDITDEQLNAIKTYMGAAEASIYLKENTSDYIDYDSFARWILAHDILGTIDDAGSNMYVYKESLNETEPSESKLKMSTLWDFDTIFMQDANNWSIPHLHRAFYYQELFKNKEFVDKYKELYAEYKDRIYFSVESAMRQLKEESGEAFEQSRQLHRQVYNKACLNSLDQQIDDVLVNLKARLDAMDGMMESLDVTETGVVAVPADGARLTERVDMYGRRIIPPVSGRKLPSGVYIEKFSDGTVKKVCGV